MYLYLVAVIAVALYVYFHRLYSSFSRAGVKSMPTVPLLGNMARFLFKQEHLKDHFTKLYFNNPNERFVGRYEFVRPSLLIRDIELVKKITVGDFKHFSEHRTMIDGTIEPIFGRNVFHLNGQEWKDMRSVIGSAFTSSKLKLMVPLMIEVGNQTTAFIKQKIQHSGGHVDIDVLDLTIKYANDIIASCAFGISINSHSDVDNKFYTTGQSIATFGFKEMLKVFGYASIPMIAKALKVKLFSESSNIFFTNLVLSSMKIREEKKIVRNDMIHLLMKAKKGQLKHDPSGSNQTDVGVAVAEESSVDKKTVHRVWTDSDLVAQPVGFIFAGIDAVSTGASWFLHEVALNPNIQERLFQEIKEHEAKNGGKFDYNSIQEMKYLDMVLSETLRRWSSIWLDRICTKDYNCGKPNDKAQKDLILRKGHMINIPVWAIHHDPQYFPEPLKFDPERFSDENKHKINPFTYMPFGLGPRNCIGSKFALCEIKVLVYMLLRQLEISPCEKTCLDNELKNGGGFSLKLKRGHWLRFRLRE